MHNNMQTLVLTKNNISILNTSRTATLMQFSANLTIFVNKLILSYILKVSYRTLVCL